MGLDGFRIAYDVEIPVTLASTGEVSISSAFEMLSMPAVNM